MIEAIAQGNYTEASAIRVGYDWDEYESGKSNEDLFAEILNYNQFHKVRHITIANWQGAFECDSCQDIVDWLVENASQLTHIESLQISDMESEECEISWINQANYTSLWPSMPWLRHLTVQGAEDLVLGEIKSDNLESLEIICGGLPASCIREITGAKTPNLTKLNLYLGVENYGFDAELSDIQALLMDSDFPKLAYLGICNSEIPTEVAELVLQSKYAPQIEVLDLSKSVFTDKSAQVILDGAPALKNLKLLDLSYHYVTEPMQKKLEALPFSVDLSDANVYDEERDYYNYPMFTE